MFAYLVILIGICPSSCWNFQPAKLYAAEEQVEQYSNDIAFGARQLEQFICDRPDTADVLKREHFLRLTLIWYFAGELKGERVYWDNREPHKNHPAVHSPAVSGLPVMVEISNKCGSSAVDKCVMLLFELFNSRVDNEYELLRTASVEDRKSRYDFAISCVRHEFAASKRLRAFFLIHPISSTSNKDSYYTALIWSNVSFSDYLRWLDGRDEKEYNPVKYYSEVYDQMTADKSK